MKKNGLYTIYAFYNIEITNECMSLRYAVELFS